jgi:hypothetical protein
MDLRMPSPTSSPFGKLIEKPLAQMGYRPYNGSNNLFAKTVGYTLLVVDTNDLTLTQFFSKVDGKGAIYKTHTISEECNILDRIKDIESFGCKYDFCWSKDLKDFSFLSISEQLGFIL